MKLDHTKLMQFPCEFNLKVIGKNQENFEKDVLTIIRKHCPQLKENALNVRTSKKDKYLAMTITFQAESKKQLDTIYQALNACKSVLMTL